MGLHSVCLQLYKVDFDPDCDLALPPQVIQLLGSLQILKDTNTFALRNTVHKATVLYCQLAEGSGFTRSPSEKTSIRCIDGVFSPCSYQKRNRNEIPSSKDEHI